jgi:hypothetical protein
MAIGTFLDKDHQPTMPEVYNALATKQPLWEKLNQFIADNYPIEGEWNFGGKKYGWNLRYRKSGKALVSLFPNQDSFVANIVLGKDQVEQALRLEYASNIGKILEETPQLHDGRWLFLTITTEEEVEDIQQLLQVKRKPKPQKLSG